MTTPFKLTDEAIDKLCALMKWGKPHQIVLIPKPGAMFDIREATPDDSKEMVCGVWVELVRGERHIRVVQRNRRLFEFWPDS